MGGSSEVSPSRSKESTNKGQKPPLLDSRRRSELAGFLVSVVGLLVLLSLISFRPEDPSLNTAADAGAATQNWIGPAGAWIADFFFQGFGLVAFLIPLVLLVVGVRWLMVRPFATPKTKAAGACLLVVSLSALLELFPYTPMVRGGGRGSGLLGYLVAVGLTHTLNRVGATIVAATMFLSSLFLVTRFSFSAAAAFLKARWQKLTRPLVDRWEAWQEARAEAAAERRRRQAERLRLLGKAPIIAPRPATRQAPPRLRAPQPETPAVETTPAPFVLLSPAQEPASSSPAPLPRAPRSDPQPAPPPKITGRGARGYKLPGASLLHPPDDTQGVDENELKERAARLTAKLGEFGVTGTITQIHPGPVVTTYEFKPEAGIKYSRITNLVDDLCLAMKAESILVERVPGKSTVGIEVPNLHREIIYLREGIESSEFAASASKLTLCLGKVIAGKIKIADLAQMPHLLIAGSTGSGKSVALNSMVLSILYKSNPDEVKLIMIDPKRLELGLYQGTPHLLTPIVTEPKQAANVLRRATFEMEERLKKLAERGVRNIEQYNASLAEESANLFDENGESPRPLPYIVIIIDELADLMMVEPQGVEESITRLAQMARAVGIHLILATQRPSVDVITGLIKANLPARISFRVASKVDSRTILDSNGAEALLGRGDMLFLPPASARLQRLHGPLVTEQEITKVVDWWKSQSQPQYDEEFLRPVKDRENDEVGEEENDEESAELDAVYDEAVRLVVESGKASTSLLQRRLRLGYGRAARLIDMMQKDGIVSAPDGSRPREVLKRPDWLREVGEPLR